MKISTAIVLTCGLVTAAAAQNPVMQFKQVVPGPAPICIIDGVRYASTECTTAIARKAGAEGRSIVNVELVKGPIVTSTYGSDAAAGVILISTTKGPSNSIGPDDPLARFLFSPELVMAHQSEIALTEPQRLAIQAAMRSAQDKFVVKQFEMSRDLEKLQHLVQSTTVDESKSLEALDHVLAGEREIKRAQLALMIQIKNQLTEQQQAALEKLRPPTSTRAWDRPEDRHAPR